jgi:hypothetical protein
LHRFLTLPNGGSLAKMHKPDMYAKFGLYETKNFLTHALGHAAPRPVMYPCLKQYLKEVSHKPPS